MRNASDAFLLQIAGIAASLLGFFVVGVFFYVQRGIFPQAVRPAQQYMKTATSSVIVLYGMALMLALSLVALSPAWVSSLYMILSAVLLWSVTRTSVATRQLHQAVEIRVMSQLALWGAALAVVGSPWILAGTEPSRADFTWALLLIGVFAFTSSASLVVSAFDLSTLEGASRNRQQTERTKNAPRGNEPGTAEGRDSSAQDAPDQGVEAVSVSERRSK